MRHVLSLLVENEPGALSRIVGLFSQRGYNIENLNVAPTEDETLSRLTLTTQADERQVEQITKHLHRLVDVVKLIDLTDVAYVERELMLIKIKAEGETRDEIKRLSDIFRGQIVDVSSTMYTVQLVGPSSKLNAFVDALEGMQILEMVRSGVCGLARNDRVLSL